MSKILNVAQYYLQTDSRTNHASRMCFSSTCAMGLKFLLPESLKGSNADDNYLKRVLKYGDTTDSQAQVKALDSYGIKASFLFNGNKAKLIQEIDKGFPVATGILHRGPSSAPRGGGHWMLAIGYTDTHVVCHDPYGEMDNAGGGYPNPGVGGKSIAYTWKNWLPRWEADGPGTGWHITFRPKTQVSRTYQNTWAGVVSAATDAGAKYPEVLAAQWALESAWGSKVTGKNNYLGIKGKGTVVTSHEFIDYLGKDVPTQSEFKDFPSLFQCVKYVVDRWYKDFGGYRGVNRATSELECTELLRKEGYATDPKYSEKLQVILKVNRG